MISKATTVEQYLAELPADRRAAIEAVRAVILKNLDKAYQERMQYGMIGYSVPHAVYPSGYHCDPKQPLPFAALASQKNYMSLYLCCVYGNAAEEKLFRDEWARSGKKLDMGKSCIRFKKLEDLPLDAIGRAIARVPASKFIAYYESVIRPGGERGAEAKTDGTTKSKSAARTKSASVKSKSAAMKSKPVAASKVKAKPKPAASPKAKAKAKAKAKSRR